MYDEHAYIIETLKIYNQSREYIKELTNEI